MLIGSLLASPASANTIANFRLIGFLNDGANVTGTFSLDVTAHQIVDVALTSTSGPFVMGTTYPGFSIDTYSSGLKTTLTFKNSATALPPISGQLLTFDFGLHDGTNLASLPTFVVDGKESAYFFLCGGLCGERFFDGSVRTLSVVTTTPIPAALPLLATALGGIGVVGWRRKRQAAAA